MIETDVFQRKIQCVEVVPYNLTYRHRSYKGAGAYIRIKAPWRLYPALFFKYHISYIDSEK